MLIVYTRHIMMRTYHRSSSVADCPTSAVGSAATLGDIPEDRSFMLNGLRLPQAGYRGAARLSSRMRSAAFSATIMVGALVLPEVRFGKIDASAMRRPTTPWTRRRASITAVRASGPIAQVQEA